MRAAARTLRSQASWTSFSPRILGDELRLNLAVCCLRLANLTAAEELLRAIPSGNPWAGPARQNLAALRQIQRMLRAAEG